MWASKLHVLISRLNNDDLFINIQDNLIEIENCDNCFNNKICQKIETFSDVFNILNILSPHYQRIRTLRRRMYEIRSLNIWLMQLENVLDEGDLSNLEIFLNNRIEKVIFKLYLAFSICKKADFQVKLADFDSI